MKSNSEKENLSQHQQQSFEHVPSDSQNQQSSYQESNFGNEQRHYNIMDPINRQRPQNQLRFQNPNPGNLPQYPFPQLYQGLTHQQKKQLDMKRKEIKMTEQPPNPADFTQLRQIYASLSQDKITPALNYINQKGQVKRRFDEQYPLPIAMDSQSGIQLPNYIIGGKVSEQTTKQLYKKPQMKGLKPQLKGTKKQYFDQQNNLKSSLTQKQAKDSTKYIKDNQQVKQYQAVGIKKDNLKSEQPQIKCQKQSQRQQVSSSNKQQQQVVNLFCHYLGDLLLIARALNRKSISSVCRQLNPIITQAIRNLQNVIIRRKIRRMAIRWADSQLKRFRHKFYQIKDGKLYGCQKRVRLGPLYKLMKMKYDRTITITNQEANQLYEGCLDLNLAIDQDTKARTNWNTQSVVWTHAEIKFFCRLILKTNDFQAISNELIKQFGGVKEKFAPSKLVVKLDSLLKGSLKKLKHLALQYEDLPTLCRVEGKDFRNICYGIHPQFTKVRKSIIQFFLASNPPKQQIGRILHIVNMFLQESRKFQQNRSKHTKMQNMISNIKSQFTQQNFQRLSIHKALTQPQYMRTPKDIYYRQKSNIKYQDQDMSIIPKGNAHELQRRLREIKQIHLQKFMKSQEEKKLLDNTQTYTDKTIALAKRNQLGKDAINRNQLHLRETHNKRNTIIQQEQTKAKPVIKSTAKTNKKTKKEASQDDHQMDLQSIKREKVKNAIINRMRNNLPSSKPQRSSSTIPIKPSLRFQSESESLQVSMGGSQQQVYNFNNFKPSQVNQLSQFSSKSYNYSQHSQQRDDQSDQFQIQPNGDNFDQYQMKREVLSDLQDEDIADFSDL